VRTLESCAVFGFFLIFPILVFSQSEAESQKTQPKTGAATSAPAAEPSQQSGDIEKIPPVRSDAIFPAVVAKVNGTTIFGRDLEEMVRRELSSIGNPEWKNLRAEYRGELTLNIITALINSRLLYQKATSTGVKATDAEVKSEMQRIASTFKDDAEMNAALASQQLDRSSLATKLREMLTVSQYVEETINKKIMVTSEELSKYYENNPDEFRHPDVVRTSHILIPVKGDAPEQDAKAKSLADSLVSRIQKGEDFAKLAREYSEDASASQGGDMGFTSKGSVAPEYSALAFSLPVGEIGLVRSQLGYHILKVTDNRKEGLFTLEEIKPRLIEAMKRMKSEDALNQLVDQLRENADIEILISAGNLLRP
jgi:parvulin-like peptidyl-prolyl isomerase